MSNMLVGVLAGVVVWAGSSLVCAILWGGWRSWLRRRWAQRRADEAEFRAIGRYWIARVRRPR